MPRRALALAVALVAPVAVGCADARSHATASDAAVAVDATRPPHAIDAATPVDATALAAIDAAPDAPLLDAGCPVPLYDAYATPGAHPVGTVADLPWQGPTARYPSGDENFSGYGPTYPMVVECSDDKDLRPYLDVTDGCLDAVKSGTRIAGQIHAAPDDAFRAVALGFTAAAPTLDVAWTDMSTQYAFEYTAQDGTQNNPGFKIFARYRTEDDLYVGSWRMDGVAQIQRKQCGVYTPLAILPTYGAPSANAFHTIAMSVVGSTLTLTLDGDAAITVDDATFPWGTAGIRIDAMNDALIDDWRVSAP